MLKDPKTLKLTWTTDQELKPSGVYEHITRGQVWIH